MEIDLRSSGVALLLGYVIVALLERMPALRLRPSALFRPFFTADVGWYLSAMAITLAFGPIFEFIARSQAEGIFPGLHGAALPWSAEVLLAILLYDFLSTQTHRMLHRFEPLWRLHKVHHSSQVLDWLATTRAHVFEHLFRGIPIQALLYLIGFPVSAMAVAIAVYTSFATLGHSNLRLPLGFTEWLFVTPRIHHLHHAPATTQTNFGTVFTIWDRLAGQLVVAGPDPDEELGVPGELEEYPQTWARALIEPFRTGR